MFASNSDATVSFTPRKDKPHIPIPADCNSNVISLTVQIRQFWPTCFWNQSKRASKMHIDRPWRRSRTGTRTEKKCRTYIEYMSMDCKGRRLALANIRTSHKTQTLHSHTHNSMAWFVWVGTTRWPESAGSSKSMAIKVSTFTQVLMITKSLYGHHSISQTQALRRQQLGDRQHNDFSAK